MGQYGLQKLKIDQNCEVNKKTMLQNHFSFSKCREEKIAENHKQNLQCIDQIVCFMLDSDDDIDFGEQSSDKSDPDSDWECEVETNADAATPDSAGMSVEPNTRPVQFANSTLVTDAADNVPAYLDVDASEIASPSHIHAASRLTSSEEWSSSSSEQQIPVKVLCGDGRVCGTCGAHCCGVCGHGVHRQGGHIRVSFHISQGVGYGEGAEVGCNEEDIDGVSSQGLGDNHADDGGDVGGNEEGDIVNTGSENEKMDGSSKDEVGEHIEEGEGVLADDSDGEDNQGVDDGPVDNVGEWIGVCGGCGVRCVCGGCGRGCGGIRRGRSNNNINIEQQQWKERGTIGNNNDTYILFTRVKKLNICMGNNSSPLDFLSYILHKKLLNYQ